MSVPLFASTARPGHLVLRSINASLSPFQADLNVWMAQHYWSCRQQVVEDAGVQRLADLLACCPTSAGRSAVAHLLERLVAQELLLFRFGRSFPSATYEELLWRVGFVSVGRCPWMVATWILSGLDQGLLSALLRGPVVSRVRALPGGGSFGQVPMPPLPVEGCRR
ncbi:MAG: hypothetical protein ACI8RZ_006057 [Myxococcota bacterium]